MKIICVRFYLTTHLDCDMYYFVGRHKTSPGRTCKRLVAARLPTMFHVKHPGERGLDGCNGYYTDC